MPSRIERDKAAISDAASGRTDASPEVTALTNTMTFAQVQQLHAYIGPNREAMQKAAETGHPVPAETHDIEMSSLRGMGTQWVVVWAMPNGTRQYARWNYIPNLPTSRDGSYAHE